MSRRRKPQWIRNIGSHNEPDSILTPLGDILETIIESPQGQAAVESINGAVRDFIARAGQPPQPQQREHARPAPRPASATAAARAVLNFSEDEELDAAKVKARRRALAGIYHDDKGGNTAAMQRVNTAADILLKSIGSK